MSDATDDAPAGSAGTQADDTAGLWILTLEKQDTK